MAMLSVILLATILIAMVPARLVLQSRKFIEVPIGEAQVNMTVANCIKETGSDANLVSKFDEGEFSDDPKVKCTHKCLFAKLGAINENDEFVKSSTNPDPCLDVKGVDSCDTASKVYKCLVENILKND